MQLTLLFTSAASSTHALALCKGKVHPRTGRTAHRGSRGITLLFHDHGTRRVWGVSVRPRPLFNLEKDPVPIVQEARWPQGRSGQTRKISPPLHRDRFPGSPVRSQSLYRLRYPAHIRLVYRPLNSFCVIESAGIALSVQWLRKALERFAADAGIFLLQHVRTRDNPASCLVGKGRFYAGAKLTRT
jgi:hypothetical protein